jgi:hypothetical protein
MDSSGYQFVYVLKLLDMEQPISLLVGDFTE